jgi:ATP dependent DNA ligase domain
MRREPLQVRKATLASVVAKAGVGIRFNEHMECDDGDAVFRDACKMGLEGIVSKRNGSPYRSGRSPDWLKMKNPACAAGGSWMRRVNWSAPLPGDARRASASERPHRRPFALAVCCNESGARSCTAAPASI